MKCKTGKAAEGIFLGTALGLVLGGVLIFSRGQVSLPGGPLKAGYGVLVTALVLTASLGLGSYLWARLGLSFQSTVEEVSFSLALGLGVLAYQVFLLGALGVITPGVLGGILFLNLAAFRTSAARMITRGKDGRLRHILSRVEGPGFHVLLALGLSGIFFLTFFQSLTPPWSPDALTYHLEGPRIFLMEGGIRLLPDVWGANGPFTVEMLYMLSLGLGSSISPKLIHLTYGLLLGFLTYALGSRFVNREVGWFSAVVLTAVPIYPLWASVAYADFTWAVYEFSAVYAFLVWVKSRQKGWLAAAGLCLGFGLGSKYLALAGGAVLGPVVILLSWKGGWKKVVRNGLLFGGTALVVGSPWYLKNWVLGGNPTYPLFFGGKGWSQVRADWLMDYLHSFGSGYEWKELLSIPWRLYGDNSAFSTFLGSVEIPSLLFPLVLLLPFGKRSRTLNLLTVITAARFVLWAFGSQQTRFLLPLMPGLSVMTAYVLVELIQKSWLGKRGLIISRGLVGGMVLATLLYSGIFLSTVKPIPVTLGKESPAEFLGRMVPNFQALRFIQQEITAQDRVMMIWDGEGFYCDQRCWPDTEHSRWSRLVHGAGSLDEINRWLDRHEITHLMMTGSYTNFILSHDPSGIHQQAYVYFKQEYLPSCLEEIYRDENSALWKRICP